MCKTPAKEDQRNSHFPEAIPNNTSMSGKSSHYPEAEFKEFEPRLKFKLWVKYGWFHLKLY